MIETCDYFCLLEFVLTYYLTTFFSVPHCLYLTILCLLLSNFQPPTLLVAAPNLFILFYFFIYSTPHLVHSLLTLDMYLICSCLIFFCCYLYIVCSGVLVDSCTERTITIDSFIIPRLPRGSTAGYK